ncbi:hypothetical protein TI05_02075 [Achromatium sp. WMS3]|nr:hypothetical protein TI05_02075 [Achromatium sp. WMS3]
MAPQFLQENAFTNLTYSQQILLGAIIILSLASWGIRYYMEDEVTTQKIDITKAADYWVDNIASYTMDAQGNLSHTLIADLAKHFPKDDSAELTNPRFEFINNNGQYWKVKSKMGWISHNVNLVKLYGNVTIERNAKAYDFPLSIKTEYIQIKPKEEYAETDKFIHIVYGTNWIKSQGLQAWFKTPMRMKFLSKVTAHYANGVKK